VLPGKRYHYHAIDKAGITRTVWYTFGMCQPEWEKDLRIVGCEAHPAYICNYRCMTRIDVERIDRRLGFPWARRG
jgi:hypothetical protein